MKWLSFVGLAIILTIVAVVVWWPGKPDALTLSPGIQVTVCIGPCPASYQGPGDVVSGATAWYSCFRGYSLSYASGSNAGCNLTRASDSHTCDILIGTSGSWTNTANCSTPGDNGTAVATWCNATTCTVNTAYEQVGNGYTLTQATVSDQPIVAFSCFGSLPCLQPGPGSNPNLECIVAACVGVTVAEPYTQVAYVERTASFTSQQTFFGSGAAGLQQSLFAASANQIAIYAGVAVAAVTATDSTPHAFLGLYNSTNSSINVDGTITGSLNPGTSVMNLGSFFEPLGTGSDFGNPFSGNITESGAWPSGLSSADQNLICHKMITYWGSSGSC